MSDKCENNVVRELELFRTTVVYLYCDWTRFRRNYVRVFGEEPKKSETIPIGHTSFGPVNGTHVAIVWLCKRKNRLDAIPTLAHELSHVADYVSNLCGINDKSGEVKAYFIESEMNAVLPKMFGLSMTQKQYDKVIKSAISEVEETEE